MGKQLLREYYALCDGGVCQDMLTEDEKRLMAAGKNSTRLMAMVVYMGKMSFKEKLRTIGN